MRLDLAQLVFVEPAQATESVLGPTAKEIAGSVDFGFVRCHDDFAALLERDVVIAAERNHLAQPRERKLGLQRTRGVVQSGVQHAAVVRRLMTTDVRFLFEENDPVVATGLPKLVGTREADEATANNRNRSHSLEDIACLGNGDRSTLAPAGAISAVASQMPHDGMTRVRALTKKLAGVEEGATFGFPAFKVGGKTFAWFPKKTEVEPGSLGVRMSILEREYRIADNPSVYYVTPHYKDYDSVLARIDKLSDAALRELVESGHEYIVAKAKSTGPKRPRRRT
jgi:hypothetical protein